jgi:hypothetical protein
MSSNHDNHHRHHPTHSYNNNSSRHHYNQHEEEEIISRNDESKTNIQMCTYYRQTIDVIFHRNSHPFVSYSYAIHSLHPITLLYIILFYNSRWCISLSRLSQDSVIINITHSFLFFFRL